MDQAHPHTAQTLSVETLANDFHYYNFSTNDPLVSQPGQYIEVKVSEDRLNSYSIAGRESFREFNLLVDTSPGGPGSKFFENLQVGDQINFLGPLGSFTLKLDDGAERLLFLATGSGLAPLKYMIESALKEQNVRLPISLYLSFSVSKEVIFQDYFQKLAQNFPNFNVKFAVDRADPNWQGEVGFITQILKKDFPDAKDVAAYLCGNKNMIAGAIQILSENGCPKRRVYTEKF